MAVATAFPAAAQTADGAGMGALLRKMPEVQGLNGRLDGLLVRISEGSGAFDTYLLGQIELDGAVAIARSKSEGIVEELATLEPAVERLSLPERQARPNWTAGCRTFCG